GDEPYNGLSPISKLSRSMQDFSPFSSEVDVVASQQQEQQQMELDQVQQRRHAVMNSRLPRCRAMTLNLRDIHTNESVEEDEDLIAPFSSFSKTKEKKY